MCAIRALPEPVLPVGDSHAGASPGVAAVAVLPCAAAPAQRLAINLMRTDPGWSTMSHHHGALDTTLYVMQGTMAFHCGPGLQARVAVLAGELASIDPHAVHAEFNPNAYQPNLGITARDTPGNFIIPCDTPGGTHDVSTGINVVPPCASSNTLPDTDPADPLGPLGPHHLRVRRLALDRVTIAPGMNFTPAAPAHGETAICVLGGAAGIIDGTSKSRLTGAGGDWWFVETGTRWSIENARMVEAAELLIIRGAPGL